MRSVTAKLNHLRMAPRKVRLVANSLKGLSVNEAEAQLLLNPKRASEPLMKLLRSAVANAKHNSQILADNLFIKEITIDQGPILKRWLPRAQGRATPIHKKTSHIRLILSEIDSAKTPRFKIVKTEKISRRKAEKISRTKEKEPEKQKPTEQEIKKPTVKKEGFMKRMFRRKSI